MRRDRMIFETLEDLIEELVSHPDEAYIKDGGKAALVYDSKHDAVLLLTGDFQGLPEEVAWELRNALAEQHPLPPREADEETDHVASWDQNQ